MDHIHAIHEVARRFEGLVHRGGTRAEGIPDDAVDRLLRRQILLVVHPGVHRLASTPLTGRLQLRAALLAAGPDATASHRSAWALHRGTSDLDVIEIAVTKDTHPPLRGVIVHRTTWMPPGHRAEVDGLACTSLERTLADLGAVLPQHLVDAAVTRAVIERRTTIRRLYRLVDEHGRQGRRGIGSLRRSLDRWLMGDKPPDSVLEVIFARLLEHSGIAMPTFQHEIRDGAGRLVARVDAAWVRHKVIAEVDGFVAHASHEAFEHDRRRQNELVALEWTVLRFTRKDLLQRRGETLRTIAAAVARAA
ncbi:MAG: DUF559 domain-containing protein [Actinobacteria bacterium]|nr:DUF559 domain-containing protein [Actinomycetota bacterium]